MIPVESLGAGNRIVLRVVEAVCFRSYKIIYSLSAKGEVLAASYRRAASFQASASKRIGSFDDVAVELSRSLIPFRGLFPCLQHPQGV